MNTLHSTLFIGVVLSSLTAAPLVGSAQDNSGEFFNGDFAGEIMAAPDARARDQRGESFGNRAGSRRGEPTSAESGILDSARKGFRDGAGDTESAPRQREPEPENDPQVEDGSQPGDAFKGLGEDDQQGSPDQEASNDSQKGSGFASVPLGRNNPAVRSIGVIMNSLDQAHVDGTLARLVETSLDLSIPINTVYSRGPLPPLTKRADMFGVSIQHGEMNFDTDLPLRFREVKRSPTWILDTAQGEVILEGVQNPRGYLTQNAEFVSP